MLYDYLRSQYPPNEPIFLSDVTLPGVSRDAVRQQFKTLCDAGKIVRYEDGVYYIPAQTRLKGGAGLSPDLVALRKYIDRKGSTDGYYSGFTFANQVGASLQVPQVREIVTNRTNSWRRAVRIRNQEFVLRKPRVPVTAENAKALQLLDLLISQPGNFLLCFGNFLHFAFQLLLLLLRSIIFFVQGLLSLEKPSF